jgi:hypothetical protein
MNNKVMRVETALLILGKGKDFDRTGMSKGQADQIIRLLEHQESQLAEALAEMERLKNG